jgi:outer membrane receptor protein involved in Fe transport
VSWTHGRQSIYLGGSYEYQNSPNVSLPNISGGYTLNGWNGLMQGTGSLSLAIGNPIIPFTEPDASVYFQDDWKLTPDLTLNLGFRWEFFSQSINLLHNITVANQTGSSPLWSTTLPDNPLNRAYYGVPDAQVEDAGSTFQNFSGNSGTAFGVGSGTRNVQLGTKVLF